MLDLQEELKHQNGRIAELQAQLQGAAAAPGAVREDVRESTPCVAAISIGRLSHVDDENGDGRPDRLVLYVDPRDGLGRFVPMVGDLSVHAALLPAGGAALTVGQVALGPVQVRDAYRSTLMGTHYTIEIPLGIAEGADGPCLVQVEFLDGLTGARLKADGSVKLR